MNYDVGVICGRIFKIIIPVMNISHEDYTDDRHTKWQM
jgi:hypothetical protein